MAIILKEEEEEDNWWDDPESTAIGGFRGVDEITKGDEWNRALATSIFYQFIIPTGKETALQKRLKDGFISWVGRRSQWATDPDLKDRFDNAKFQSINEKALNFLLESTLKDLNEHAGHYVKPGNYMDAETGEELEFPYGMILNNPKGFSFADDVETDNEETKTYNELRELRNQEKGEIDALRTAKKSAGKKGKETIQAQVDVLEASIKTIEEDMEAMKNFSFDDNVTLQEVLDNTAEAQKFYMLMSFDPEDEDAAVALGNLIAEEYVEWKNDPALFEETYGISFKAYEKEVEAAQKRWVNMLGLTAKLKEAWLESETDINVSVDEFLEFIDLTDESIYPIKVQVVEGDEDEDEKIRGEMGLVDKNTREEFEEWLETASQEEQIATIQKIADHYYRYTLKPLFKGTGTWIKIEPRAPESEERTGKRTEFVNRPIRVSVEAIEQYLLDGVFDADSIDVPKRLSDKNLSNVKIKINLNNKEVPMEKLFAMVVGAESESTIGSKKNPLKKYRIKDEKIPISYSQPIDDDVIKFVPYLMVRELHREVLAGLTAFIKRTSSTTEESIDNKVKQWLSRGQYGYFTSILEHIKEIDELQDANLDRRLDIPEDFDINYWLKPNGTMRRDYNQMIDSIVGYTSGKKKEAKFLNQLKLLKSVLIRLDNLKEDYILKDDKEKEDEDTIDFEAFEELSEEEMAELSEEEKEEYENAKELATQEKRLKREKASELASAQEEREREEEQVDVAGDADEGGLTVDTEGRLKGIGEDEEEIVEDEDEEEELTSYLYNLDGDTLMNAVSWLTTFIRDYESFIKYKRLNLSDASFIKDMRKLLKLIKWDEWNIGDAAPSNLFIDRLDDFKEEKDDDGNWTSETAESKGYAEEMKKGLEMRWDEVKEDFKIPKPEDFIRLVHKINLGEIIASAIFESELNDVRHAIVTLSTKNLNLVINTKDRKLELKGNILWSSKAASYMEYKTAASHRKAPKYMKLHPSEKKPSKGTGGKDMTYGGEEQTRAPVPYNRVRFEYYEAIRTRTQILMGIVKG